MNYQLFLQILLQLSTGSRATLVMEDNPIYITHLQRKRGACRLTIDVYKGDGRIPSHVRALLPSTGILRWTQESPYLQLQGDTISLIDEVEIEKTKYIPFKRKIESFLHIAKEWEELFLKDS